VSTANIREHKVTELSQRYQRALQKHLDQGLRASLQPARRLGQQAMSRGLETLDMVKIHERALVTLVSPGDSPTTREATVRRAGTFFAEAITPIEARHRTAVDTRLLLDQLNAALRQRSVKLAASHRRLKAEVAQRRSAEQALRKSEQHYGRLLEQSRQMQEQLRNLSRQLLLAQEEERKKISRELHDVIAQTLTSINARLASLKQGATRTTSDLARGIGQTQELVRRSVEIVHRFARDLRPAVLDDVGLIPALHTFMKQFRAETGVRVSLSAFAGVDHVGGDKRTVLYRVAQEALNNVARHAQASRADVKIHRLDGAIRMRINDDGKGFPTEHVLHGRKKSRLGLIGMRERVEMVGGDFTIQSAPGKGTTVLVKIPLPSGVRRRKRS
jgi:signal transduction histidine kinase